MVVQTKMEEEEEENLLRIEYFQQIQFLKLMEMLKQSEIIIAHVLVNGSRYYSIHFLFKLLDVRLSSIC